MSTLKPHIWQGCYRLRRRFFHPQIDTVSHLFAGPFMSYFMNPWHCFFVFVFTFQNGHGQRVGGDRPIRSYSVHVSCRQVLRLEPNNEAARRELEKMEEFLPDLGGRSRGGWR